MYRARVTLWGCVELRDHSLMIGKRLIGMAISRKSCADGLFGWCGLDAINSGLVAAPAANGFERRGGENSLSYSK